MSDFIDELRELDRLLTDMRISNEVIGMRLRNSWKPAEAADEIERLREQLIGAENEIGDLKRAIAMIMSDAQGN